MARQARRVVPGFPYHVIQRGHDRRAVFLDDIDRRHYLEGLQEACVAHDLAVHAYVLMDNHVHLLCTPGQADSLSLAMQAVGRRYVRRFNRRHARTGTLWEGRFRSSLVEADRYFLACVRYIESNPVRAGRVADVADWPWSSHRHHIGLTVDPLVSPHACLFALGNTPFDRESAYRHLFDDGLKMSEQEWLRQRLLRGKPTASTDFQKDLEATSGIQLLTRPVGRPRTR